MAKISGVINTLNEEDNITDCIQSLRPYVNEIIVCDMYSDDKTVSIAENLGAKVVYYDRVGYVEPARKYAIENAKYDWILVLDADERMTSDLGDKLTEISADKNLDIEVVQFWALFWYFGAWVKHGGFFFGGWTRFFRKETYLKTFDESELMVHKNFSNLKKLEKKLQLNKKYYIKHYAYDTVEKYVRKTILKYSVIEAENMVNSGYTFSYLKLIFSPIKQFLLRFFWKKGFKDGTRGLILASLFSIHRFCVWANFWYLLKVEKSNS